MVPSFEYLVASAIDNGICDYFTLKPTYALCCLLSPVKIPCKCPWRNDYVEPQIVMYLGVWKGEGYYAYLEQWGEMKGSKLTKLTHIHILNQRGKVIQDVEFTPFVMTLNPSQFEQL